MSRRNRPRLRGERRSLALPVIIVGAALILAAAFLMVRQGRGGTGASVSDSGSPQITVDQQKVDYGYVKFGEMRSIKLTVTNTGKGVLRFTKSPYVEVLEGC
jgi:hypothetical protein